MVEGREATEAEQNRPYRVLVAIVFTLAIVASCILLLRGIVRHLDRLQPALDIRRPDQVDTRALRACAEDFSRLALDLQRSVVRHFGAQPGPEPLTSWEAKIEALELERQRVVLRCRLDEPSSDRSSADLEEAASELENALRSYRLLYERLRQDAEPQLSRALGALARARAALDERE